MYIKDVIKDAKQYARHLGKMRVSPNILLFAMLKDKKIEADFVINNSNINFLKYILNPNVLKTTNSPRNIQLSTSLQRIVSGYKRSDSAYDLFIRLHNEKYIRDILSIADYSYKQNEDLYGFFIKKYCNKLQTGKVLDKQVPVYRKMLRASKHHNISLITSSGNMSSEVIKNFAKYVDKKSTIFSFDLFKLLSESEGSLFSIVSGIFSEIDNNYIYIPNFLQTVYWIKALNYKDLYMLLLTKSKQCKIITKVSRNRLDRDIYAEGNIMNMFFINSPQVTFNELRDILCEKAKEYELFYDINITSKEIDDAIKSSIEFSKYLSQPASSIKMLSRTALIKYSNEEEKFNIDHNNDNIQNNVNKLLKLKTILLDNIIGQNQQIDSFVESLGKANLNNDNMILLNYIFEGEYGVGKFTLARLTANFLFGQDSICFIDLSNYAKTPYKYKFEYDLKRTLESFYGGIIYLENFDQIDMDEINPLELIKKLLKEIPQSSYILGCIVIASIHNNLQNLKNSISIINNFDKIIIFNKLSIRDLEKISVMETVKSKKYIKTVRNPLFLSVNAEINNAHDIKAMTLK